MKKDNPETRVVTPAQTRKTMRSVKLPDRSFKVRFKIFRFGFTDFDVFARHFTEAACWQIATHNERTHTYTFQNGWNITLHPHGDISLYSPLLKREEATVRSRANDVGFVPTTRIAVLDKCDDDAKSRIFATSRKSYPDNSSRAEARA